MAQLTIQILAGQRSGSVYETGDQDLFFGRDATVSQLVIDLPEVSRQHGQICRLPDGSWQLVNLSNNGTWAGRKRIKKPLPITQECIVRVGKTDILRITPVVETFDPANAPLIEESITEDVAPPKKNRKLVIGVGIYFVAMTLIVAVLWSMQDNDNNNDPAKNPLNSLIMTDASLQQMLSMPPVRKGADTKQFESLTSSARALYSSNTKQEDHTILNAFLIYREALSYSEDGELRYPEDRIVFPKLKREALGVLTKEYIEATQQMKRHLFTPAEKDLRTIYDSYAGRVSQEYKNHIGRLISECVKQRNERQP